MESKRTLIEAYISARFPYSEVCGLGLCSQHLVALYPYDAEVESGYLIAVLREAGNRKLFERLLLPEMEQIQRHLNGGEILPFEPTTSLFIRLICDAKKSAPQVQRWLAGEDDEETANLISGTFELLHEIMMSVYVASDDQAFQLWFEDADEQHPPTQANYQVDSLVEAYFDFLSETAVLDAVAA